MKKSLLAGALLCLSAGQVSAQSKGTYVKFGAGYQFAVARQSMQFRNMSQSSNSLIESDTRHSLQNGITPIVGIGHMFTENIGFELGASYLFGKSSEILQKYSDQGSMQNHIMKVHANSLMITPSLRLSAPLSKKVAVYTRTGLVIPVLTKVQKQLKSTYFEQGGQAVVDAEYTIRNHFAVGFSGAAGFAFHTSDKITIHMELAGQMLNLWSKRENIETFKINGMNADAMSSGFYKEILYVKEAKSANGNQALSYQSPFHSLGANVGMSFNF